MSQHLLRQRFLQGHEHCRPNDGVETHDFLAHQVDIHRPVLLVQFIVFRISQSGDVVGQRIQPYVDDVFFVNRNRDSPVEGGTGNTKIFQTLLHKGNHFISARFRLQKIRIVPEIIQQRIAVLGQTEEVRIFAHLLHFTTAVRALAVYQLRFRPVGFTRSAVPAFVLALVDVSVLVHLHEDVLYSLDMTRLRGPNEIVVADFHLIPESQNGFHHTVYVFFRCDLSFFRTFLNLLSVFIRSGEEAHIVSAESLEPSHGIRHYGAVGVTDMQFRTWIINWCSNIICSLVFRHFP